MQHLNLCIAMNGKHIVVIGGGRVALRKIRTLSGTNARIRIVSPEITQELRDLLGFDVSWVCSEYDKGHLHGAFMAIAATDVATVNSAVCRDASGMGILALNAGNGAEGDCSFPALLSRGGLQIAVSTGGASPSYSAAVRDRIAGLIGEEYGMALQLLSKVREKLLTAESGRTYNEKIMHDLSAAAIEELVKDGDMDAVAAKITEITGHPFTRQDLSDNKETTS